MTNAPLTCSNCGSPVPGSEGLAEMPGAELRCPACLPASVRAAVDALPTARPETYQAVPVDAARSISLGYGKDIVVIVAWDLPSNMVHVTTYGRTAEWKSPAARLGEILTTAALGTVERAGGMKFEDFRDRTAAEWAAEREELLKRIAQLEQCHE